MNLLFSSLKIRGLEIKNRIVMSPMCQYQAKDGMANDWHMVHYGTRAVGGAGMIVVEATAVVPEGRISPDDLGLWKDEQIIPLGRICQFLRRQQCVPAIQLAHAGRKASTYAPWLGDKAIPTDEGGWIPVAPSAIPFNSEYALPHALSIDEILHIEQSFVEATMRAIKAGFQVIEIHAAHGYLFHEFLASATNHRTDEYGGNLENRMRFLIETVTKVRAAMSPEMPLFVRISATDYAHNGWDLEQSVELCKRLQAIGVDLIDASTGGLMPKIRIPVDYGYQLKYARTIKSQSGVMTGAVGKITTAEQAEAVLFNDVADLIFIGRTFLAKPYFALKARTKFNEKIDWPIEYSSLS